MRKKNLLLIVDPQNDFVKSDGALSVKGADEDMDRLAGFIVRHGDKIDKVIVTMDSHMPGHIATPSYWQDAAGVHPAPFTTISVKDVGEGKWKAVSDKAGEYLERLEKAGKTHTIWPPHCLFGTPGWAVYGPLYAVLAGWADKPGKDFEFYTKGLNSRDTEMFSVVRPEVSSDDASVNKNAERFLSLLEGYGRILIAGEAENFCVKESVRDIAVMRPALVEKLVLLKDCMSLIPIPNDKTADFWELLKKKGMMLTESEKVNFQ